MEQPEQPIPASAGSGSVVDSAQPVSMETQPEQVSINPAEPAMDLSKTLGATQIPEVKSTDTVPSTATHMECDAPQLKPAESSDSMNVVEGGVSTGAKTITGALPGESLVSSAKIASEPLALQTPLAAGSDMASQSVPRVPTPVGAMEISEPLVSGQKPLPGMLVAKETKRISPVAGLLQTPQASTSVLPPTKPKSIFSSIFPSKPPPKPLAPSNAVSSASGPSGPVHIAAALTPMSVGQVFAPNKPPPADVAEVKDSSSLHSTSIPVSHSQDTVKADIFAMETKPAAESVATEKSPADVAKQETTPDAGTTVSEILPAASDTKPSEELAKVSSPSVSAVGTAEPGISKAETSIATLTATVKTEVKQPPIAAKTMRRESRKSTATSPTMSGGEQKKKLKYAGSPGGKQKKKRPPPKEDGQDGRNDFYCWICHKEGEVLCCELCPRVFHAKCLHMSVEPEGDWFCPECEKITDAECKETQSRAMSTLTIDQFSLLLKYVIQRMKIPMSEPFHEPVDTKMFPDYLDYVFHPMDLSTIEKNVKKRKYGCPEAFVIEFKWVIHNCIIYNSPHSKLTQTAKAMLKIAERELNEIEVCPECYLNSCRKRENWFCEPCKELHPLVWAKLQGFPHWPAKALRIEKGLVDVRFFGQHDRAWIPLSGCYLISKDLPLPVKNKKKGKGPGMRGGLDNAMLEMQGYIENIKKITGEFEYAPPRTLLTHCDLYRRSGTLSMSTGKSGQTAKLQEISKGKEGQAEGRGTSKAEGGDNKAKIELKDIGGGKESMKPASMPTLTPKKAKMVTTSGEHPARSFATKKKKASMEFLKKTIESCKASLGIENLQDVRMNSGSEETSSSSSDEENEGEETKDDAQPGAEKETKPQPTPSVEKPGNDDDDSDAELVIDLGDMEESADTASRKSMADKSADAGNSTKGDDIAAKKRRTDDSSDKPVAGKPLKSILVHPPKSSDKDERKKMLAKALSEKIATGKRKHDVEGPSGASPSTKVRKTQDPHDKLGHPKDKKKSHHGKDMSSKSKSGVKPSGESSGIRKDGHTGSEKRPPDSFKHKHKEGKDAQKIPSKKVPPPPDKPTRVDKMPTISDARKLFNGGRIPRKNPVNASDEEAGDVKEPEERDAPMEATQTSDIITRRKSLDRSHLPLRNPGTVNGVNRSSVDKERRGGEENITFASLKKYSDKVMDTVQKVFYEMYTDMMVPLQANASPDKSTDASTASAMHQVAQMRLELERLKWMHEQEMAELKHNHDLTVAEIRQSLENEKKQLLIDARLQAEAEKNCAVDEAKRKQWCAYCNKQAIFYCCWNTSYCDYPCQQKHWAQHMNSCTQAKEGGGAGESKTLHPAKSVASSRTLSLPATAVEKATLSASGGPAVTSKPMSSGKSKIMLPTSLLIAKQTPSSLGKSVAKTYLTTSEKMVRVSVPVIPDSTESKVAAQAPQKTGFTISAIGARLLAAKQSITSSRDPETTSAKVFTTKPLEPDIHSGASSSLVSDHEITTLDSPLSPDAKPSSPTNEVSPLVVSKKSDPATDSKPNAASSSAQNPSSLSTESMPVSAITMIGQVKVTATPAAPAATSADTKGKEGQLSEGHGTIVAPTKTTAGKRAPASSILGFSSPSVIASMITDMDTPLSSSLSSGDGSSFSDTPEKKEDKKVQLSAIGSAFTKVIPDTSKHPSTGGKETAEISQKALSFSAKPTATPPDTAGSTASFKPIDAKPPDPGPSPEVKEAVPVVAPVMADSYLSTLQNKLVNKGPEKTPTPPITESMAEKESKRPVNTELYRPVFYTPTETKQKEKETSLDDTISPT